LVQGKKVKRRREQHGVALITALIITSIAVSLATLIIYRQQIQIRLTNNISNLEQNYQYAYGMEDFAGTILRRSWEDQPNFDSLNDEWYSENGLVLPITGGLMTGKLFDLHARINLNSLLRPLTEKKSPNANNQTDQNENQNTDPENNNTTETTQNDSITNLDEEKEYDDIAKVTRERITRLINIIDPEQDMGPNGNSDRPDDDSGIGFGAETPYYQSIEPSYYSANTEMISPTELRLIKNIKEKYYKTITPHISTLPIVTNKKATSTPINVNTASNIVLQALGFTPDAITNILEVRKEDPFEKIEDFKQLAVVESALITEENPNGDVDPLDLDVKSEYFLLQGKVEINNTRLFINSILWRNKSGQVSVIMRDFSNPNSISKASE